MKNGLDEQYIDLLKDILENGIEKQTRNGKTLSVFGRSIRYKFKDGKFPLLTTKKMAWKTMVTELLYFLRGDTNIKYLVDNNCDIWNGDLSKHHNVNIEEYKELSKLDVNLYEGGALYPHQWRNFGSSRYSRKRITIPFKTFFKKEEPNINSKNSNIGKVYTTLDYGSYIVLDSFNKGERNEAHYKIQFIDTNSLKNIRKDKLGTNIIDPYRANKNGVACMGDYKKYNGLNIEKLKNIWNGMISRCYNPSNDNYIYYGGKGVYVENRWLCFEYFLSDVTKIKNWESKLNNWDEYELDKDIYGDGFKYSLESCCWVSKSDNLKKSKENFEYQVTNGIDTYEFVNHVDFMNNFNINNQGNFASMLRGERLSCEGWSLIKKEKISDGVDQIKELISTLRTNPDSRRMLVTAWNPSQLHDLCLPACHYGFQVYTRELSLEERITLVNPIPNLFTHEDCDVINLPKRAISLMWNQRSVDTFLGLPFNIASYGLLLEIIAKEVNMVPDELIGNLGDVHLYSNHIEQAKEQIGRVYTSDERSEMLKEAMGYENYHNAIEELMPFGGGLSEYYETYKIPHHTREPYPLPTLSYLDEYHFIYSFINYLTDSKIVGEISFSEKINHFRPDFFKIENYKSHPAIKAPLSN
jgi:thymidylate synthase